MGINKEKCFVLLTLISGLLLSCNIINSNTEQQSIDKEASISPSYNYINHELRSDSTEFRINFNSDSPLVFTDKTTSHYHFYLGMAYDRYSEIRVFDLSFEVSGPASGQRIITLRLFDNALPKAKNYEIAGVKKSFEVYETVPNETVGKLLVQYIDNNTETSEWTPENYFHSGNLEILEIGSTSIKGRFEINFSENDAFDQISGEFTKVY